MDTSVDDMDFLFGSICKFCNFIVYWWTKCTFFYYIYIFCCKLMLIYCYNSTQIFFLLCLYLRYTCCLLYTNRPLTRDFHSSFTVDDRYRVYFITYYFQCFSYYSVLFCFIENKQNQFININLSPFTYLIVIKVILLHQPSLCSLNLL